MLERQINNFCWLTINIKCDDKALATWYVFCNNALIIFVFNRCSRCCPWYWALNNLTWSSLTSVMYTNTWQGVLEIPLNPPECRDLHWQPLSNTPLCYDNEDTNGKSRKICKRLNCHARQLCHLAFCYSRLFKAFLLFIYSFHVCTYQSLCNFRAKQALTCICSM